MKKLVMKMCEPADCPVGELFLACVYRVSPENVNAIHIKPVKMLFIDTETGEETPVEFVMPAERVAPAILTRESRIMVPK